MTLEREMTPALRDMLDRSFRSLDDGRAIAASVRAEVAATPQQRGWLPPVRRPADRSVVALAGTVAAAIAIVLLVGVAATFGPNVTNEDALTPAATDILPGVELEVEQIGPGIVRMTGDGVRGDTRDFMRVAVGHDGGVWALLDRELVRLGQPGSRTVVRVNGEFPRLAPAGDGTLWLGDTERGFRQFDGAELRSVGGGKREAADSPDLSRRPRSIAAMAAHPDGSLWVLSPEGDGPAWSFTTVERLAEDGWTSYRLSDHLPPGTCRTSACALPSGLAVTPDGIVWVSYADHDTGRGALVRFDGERWEAVRPLDDGRDHPVTGLAAGADGTLWAAIRTPMIERGTQGGELWANALARFDGKSWAVFPRPRVQILAAGADGAAWLAETGLEQAEPCRCDNRPTRIVRFDGVDWTPYPELDFRGRFWDPNVSAGPHGGLWLASYWGAEGFPHGLYYLQPER